MNNLETKEDDTLTEQTENVNNQVTMRQHRYINTFEIWDELMFFLEKMEQQALRIL